MDRIKLLSIAEDEPTRAQGLMFVKYLPEDAGMLFRFASPRILSFWMKDTYLDLDIAFIDHRDKIVKTERLIPLSTRGVSSGCPCVMALEVPAGSLSKAGVAVGDIVRVDEDSMSVAFERPGDGR